MSIIGILAQDITKTDSLQVPTVDAIGGGVEMVRGEEVKSLYLVQCIWPVKKSLSQL